MMIFIFTHFGLNICILFLYFATLKCFVFIIGKLVWLWCSNSFKIEKPTWQRIMFLIPRGQLHKLVTMLRLYVQTIHPKFYVIVIFNTI